MTKGILKTEAEADKIHSIRGRMGTDSGTQGKE